MRRVAEYWAERKYRRKCSVSIGADVRISFRKIGGPPPSSLTVGSGTIFEGHISADRSAAVVSIGRNTFVGNSQLVCAERIVIGDDVLISWGCTIVDHNSHATSWLERRSDVREAHLGRKNWANIKIGAVTICDKAWLGFNSIVLQGVTVGEGSVVGAGSVVTKNVEPYTVVGGNPAKLIRHCA
jgi:acetyltransferase-like isoleucine patch superfamily enzyme